MVRAPRAVRKILHARHFAILRAIREDPSLTCFERCMLRTIEDFADDTTGEAWPSIPTLAAGCGVGMTTAKKLIARLAELGWLEVTSGQAQRVPNLYRVTPTR